MGVNDDDHQDIEALETLSLTDFPLTDDGNYSTVQDDQHGNPPSLATEDLFEFCSTGGTQVSPVHMMSHAEDMISGGKLVPININDQPNQEQPPTTQTQMRHKKQGRRSESMRELKSTTNKATASKLVRNSYSLDYKKLNRNSRLNYEPTAEMISNRISLSTKTSSSRWSDLVFGPLKVPPEMDLQDIRNRQIVQNTSKSLFPSAETKDRLPVSRVGHHRKTSWGVLGILSCKSSGSVAVTMPLS